MEENELPFKTPEFKKSWEEWIQWRKEKRLPKYVPSGLKKTFTHLVNISNNDDKIAIAIIDYSISNNYQGLFALKNQANGNQQTSGQIAKPGTSQARVNALRKWGSE